MANLLIKIGLGMLAAWGCWSLVRESEQERRWVSAALFALLFLVVANAVIDSAIEFYKLITH